jgi:hypothetical protein
MTDAEMIDWLEAYVNRYGAIILHDGNSNAHSIPGLGLRPGYINRTLRQAIAQAAGRHSLSSSETAPVPPPAD